MPSDRNETVLVILPTGRTKHVRQKEALRMLVNGEVDLVCSNPFTLRVIHTPICAEERQRGSAHARGYTYRWHKASRAFLELRPLCADPYGLHGAIPASAEVVDHVIPQRGDERLFWDRGNWQPLCHSCHSRKTALEADEIEASNLRPGLELDQIIDVTPL